MQKEGDYDDAVARLKEFKESDYSKGGMGVLNFNDLLLASHNCYQIWVNTHDAALVTAMDSTYPGTV